eukprot:6491368-Pyramimonas_sp.AAC.1
MATVLRTLPGFERYDGSEGPPEVSVSDPRPTTRFETSNNLLTAKHVDDINTASTTDTIDKYVKCVEDTFGKCKLNAHTCANWAVKCTKDEDGSVTLDQDENINRPTQHPELTGADADAQAAEMVACMFVSLRGALAYALITQ